MQIIIVYCRDIARHAPFTSNELHTCIHTRQSRTDIFTKTFYWWQCTYLLVGHWNCDRTCKLGRKIQIRHIFLNYYRDWALDLCTAWLYCYAIFSYPFSTSLIYNVVKYIGYNLLYLIAVRGTLKNQREINI